MSWIYVGLLAGSLVTSTHDNKEACEGRGVTLKEKGVLGKCVEMTSSNVLSFGGSIGSMMCNRNGTIGPC